MNQQQNKYITINEDQEGSRLDRILHKLYPGLNQGVIEKSLRNKLINVNDKKSSANYRVQVGDAIKIADHLVKDIVKQKSAKKITREQIDLVVNNIIYRDGDLIVLNKPAGLAVQGGSKIKTSLDDIMPYVLESFGTWSEEKTPHKLVHRLDKETSGILLIALNNKTAQELAYGFKNHLIEKKYMAVLTGKVNVNNGQISTIIDKENKATEENAVTNYKVLSKKNKASLVEFRPVTGKTHQLRLHSLELGFPILGDYKYDSSLGDEKKINLHLHAAEIIFPYQGRNFKIKADLPDYFQKTVKEIFKI